MSYRDGQAAPRKARVSLYQGAFGRHVLGQAMESAIAEMDWSAYRRVLVKPNLTVSADAWAITRDRALDVVLQIVREHYSGELVVAEGCGGEPTLVAMKAVRYDMVAARYGAQLLDLNADETVPVTIYDARERPLTVRLARSAVESDCRISLTLPKTHDAALVTLGIKNMVMGSVVNRRVSGLPGRPWWLDRLGQVLHGHGNGWGSDKRAMHQGPAMINVNLARVAGRVWPHLVILDGFTGMEGNGPVGGTPRPWGVAIAGTDALAADALAAELMGFPPEQVGYLHYCAQLGLGCAAREGMEIVGNVEPDAVRMPFVPHATHEWQRQWPREGAEALLAARPNRHCDPSGGECQSETD